MASRSYTSRAGYTSKPAFTKSQAQNMKSSTARESKKRKTDHDYDFDNEIAARNALAGISSSPPSKKARKKLDPDEEKRLRRFRNNPPQSYRERLDRVRSQRMFLIDRKRKMSEDGTHEEEVFDLAGTTGNVYQITITKVPRCTCPDNGKGNQCKHIIYVSPPFPLTLTSELTRRKGNGQRAQSPRRPRLPTCAAQHRTLRALRLSTHYHAVFFIQQQSRRSHHRHWRLPQAHRRRLSRVRDGVRGVGTRHARRDPVVQSRVRPEHPPALL